MLLKVFKNLSCGVILFTCTNLLPPSPIAAGSSLQFIPDILTAGFAHTDLSMTRLKKTSQDNRLSGFCKKLSREFVKLGWQENPCGKVAWRYELLSKNGDPLIYWDHGSGEQITLILSGVHPDEYTPVPMGFLLANHILEAKREFDAQNYRVIIAPLVNPDGFFLKRPARVNANGIDVNRNFLTSDWYQKAHDWWRDSKRMSHRHFPGFFAQSEAETLFQSELITQKHPDKIVSIHAPLGFLDYDGPGDRVRFPKSIRDQMAKNLAKSMSEKTNNYRVVDYSFYPGSLGNFAGNQLKIPTVTLELKTTDPKMVREYWKQFLPAMMHSIEYPYERYGSVIDKSETSL